MSGMASINHDLDKNISTSINVLLQFMHLCKRELSSFQNSRVYFDYISEVKSYHICLDDYLFVR